MATESSMNALSGALRQWLAPALQRLGATPVQVWRNLVTFAGIALLAWVTAQLLWLALSSTPAWDRLGELSLEAPGAATRSAPADAGIDIGRLARLNLFGDASQAARRPLEELPDAAETALPIHLTGIMHVDDPVAARAVIHYGNAQEEQHRVGDRLKTGVNVTLERILADRVIIRNQGRYESVFLYDDELAQRIRNRKEWLQRPAPVEGADGPAPAQRADGPAPAATSRDAGPNVLDRRQDQRAVSVARRLHQTMLTEPAKLGHLAAVSPASQNGHAVGYRIDGAADTEQLSALGLRPGDIVTHVNGAPITNASEALAVYQQLRNATEGDVSILRGDVSMTIKLRLQ